MVGSPLAILGAVAGSVVGILALGPRVTGQPYAGEDLERLFTLASQVAMAVEDALDPDDDARPDRGPRPH